MRTIIIGYCTVKLTFFLLEIEASGCPSAFLEGLLLLLLWEKTISDD